MSVESKLPVTHVIFDFDGTLVNSIEVMLKVVQNFAKSYGKEVNHEMQKKLPNTKSMKEVFKTIYDYLGLINEMTFDEFSQKVAKNFYGSSFELNPGVDRLIKHLHKNSIPMSIATNGTKNHLSIICSKFGTYFDVGNYFSHIVFGDDEEVVNSKPNPDIYFVCAKRFQIQPKDKRNVLIIEDSLNGMEGAVASGMQTVWLKDHTFFDSMDPIENKVSAIISSFNEFKPEIFGLTAFDS